MDRGEEEKWSNLYLCCFPTLQPIQQDNAHLHTAKATFLVQELIQETHE